MSKRLKVWLNHEQAQQLTGSGLPSEADELRQQLATVQAEREQYRAALGRAHVILSLARKQVETLRALTMMGEGQSWRALDDIDAVLADPLGQQAAQEWQRLKAVAKAAQRYRSGSGILPHRDGCANRYGKPCDCGKLEFIAGLAALNSAARPASQPPEKGEQG